MGRSGAEWGRVGLGGVGEGLGMHWDAIKQLQDDAGGRGGGLPGHGAGLQGWAAWGRFGPSGAV